MVLPQSAVSAVERAIRGYDSAVPAGSDRDVLEYLPFDTAQLGGAALLPPGAPRRTLADRRTAVPGGATSARPKTKVSAAVAEDWGGHGGEGTGMGVIGILFNSEL